MNPSIRQLQIFVHVYHAGNLTRAAAELGLTQSAVSLQLRHLEGVFGLRLFDRTTRALHPTNAATQAVIAAEQILAAASGLTRHMRDLNNADAGKVTFVASAGFASTFMPSILATFRKLHPEIGITLYDVPAHELIRKMLTTDAEFALGSIKPDNFDVTSEPILKGRLSVVGINKGAFAARKHVSWDELSSLPTIATLRETPTRINIDAALAKFNKSFRPKLEVSLSTTALSMTAAGLGVCIVPDYIVTRDQFPTLVSRPLVRPALVREVFLIRRVGRSLSPAAARLVGQIRGEFRKTANTE